MSVLLEALEKSVVYKYADALRAMPILQQITSTQISELERRVEPATDAATVMAVLPLRRIEACESQVAHFQNRWYSDHETRMPSFGVTIKIGRVVYDVQMIKAMRSWHTATQRLNDIDETITWINGVNPSPWHPDDEGWKEDCLDPDTLIERLKESMYWGISTDHFFT
ncbi:hypothetical protein PF005_g30806 [Phytophthora fragariae]|uniref:Uncharacterized protein n=2 Tax=Phytophthora fragariae TaxID=53985 RepID=A0A6A3PYA3_9STRA|nr:hypothetical protein PF003_g22247 [Phytophthora fragariae]KAE8893806.1 hypothetical protein PF003_g22249 [Phytophthora fragariae]KAE8893921.1 hypothetical protein PF003_g22250 [Phytophthora fragariae]KAE8893922.1 hypothetical protein PF003_g22251 [Phytophthora fragariae]KAE8918698.1 hypothetical protein PF009_g30989 [Phytophthora fragariae]